MAFIDGENFTMRGQDLAKENALTLVPGDYWQEDMFLWAPYNTENQPGRWNFVNLDIPRLERNPIRCHYYTSVAGDDQKVDQITDQIWKLGFAPRVFKKAKKDQKSKGVDISLTTDMLNHAFAGHYGVAVLVTGDGDYVPVVEAVKRTGRIVIVSTLNSGLNPKLRRAADAYFDMTPPFLEWWSRYRTNLAAQKGH